MDHYTKTSSVTDTREEKKESYDIRVKSGSKIRNIISQASRMLQNKKGEKIVLTGSGPTVTKTITCAEIVKRKNRGLHQLNKLFYIKVDDTWEPEGESLDKLQVTKRIPSISITLSKVPLDVTQPGYQAPGKSKSLVQFGDEDWELAWEDDSPKATQRTNINKRWMEKSKKSKNKGSEDDETNAKSMKTVHEMAHSYQEDNLEKGANGSLSHENTSTCEGHEGHSMGIALKEEWGHSCESQRTDTQKCKSAQRRAKSYRDQKPKQSPQKRQKSEGSTAMPD